MRLSSFPFWSAVTALSCSLCFGPPAPVTAESAGSVEPLVAATATPHPDTRLSDLVITRWTTENGLPTNSLTGVLQTREGLMWASSFYGLVQYDGQSFSYLNKNDFPDLPTSGFLALAEDPDGGRLWLGLQGGGVYSYDSEQGLLPHPAKGNPQVDVIALHWSSRGDLWVGTEDAGAFLLELSEGLDGNPAFQSVDLPAFDGQRVSALAESADGTIWIGSGGSGLWRRRSEGQDFESVPLPTRRVQALLPDADGLTMWIGTDDGVLLWAGEEAEPTAVEATRGLYVQDLVQDAYGLLWIGAEQGLFRLRPDASGGASGDENRLQSLADHRRGSFGRVVNLSFDQEGSLWIATTLDGLFQARQGSFSNLGVAQGLTTSRVNSLVELEDGTVLISGDRNVLHRRQDGRLETETVDLLPETTAIRHLGRDRFGTLWISSYGGLIRRRPDGDRLWGTEHGLPSNHLRATLEDSQGRFWIGTERGLVRLEDVAETLEDRPNFQPVPGISSADFILSLSEGADGKVRVGSRHGLQTFHADGRVDVLRTQTDLPGSVVFSSYVDSDGDLWVLTNGGLARVRYGADGSPRVATVDSSRGLPTDSVFDLHEDEHGYFWIASIVGVVRVARARVNDFLDGHVPSLQTLLLDRSDGMASSECAGARHLLAASDGSLWFPTLDGVSRIHPDTILQAKRPPPVIIRRARLDDVPRLPTADGLVKISPDVRRVGIDFSVMSFLAPWRARIRYRLDDFDEDWISAGRTRKAEYTNLPPGTYTFRVVAADTNGVWSSDAAELTLKVVPAFYQTLPFYVGAASLLFLLGFLTLNWRVRIERRVNVRLQEDVSEKKRIVDALEAQNAELERYTYTVSHDLKSPLITIRGTLDMLGDELPADIPDTVREDLSLIGDSARRMEQLLDDLLNLSRAEHAELRRESVSMTELANEAGRALTALIQEHRVELRIAPDMPEVEADRVRLFQVFQNLIGNAVKFMDDQPEPRVVVGHRETDGKRIFFVEDNGRGIEPELQLKVFELFNRLDRSTEGSGIGLAIVQRVVQLHGGEIWVESDGHGKGTTFCFTLPDPGPQSPEPQSPEPQSPEPQSPEPQSPEPPSHDVRTLDF